jgi:hypothetical protein
LLADITGIYRSIANLEKNISDLVARSGSVQTRHFNAYVAAPGLVGSESSQNFFIMDPSSYNNGYSYIYGGHRMGFTLTSKPVVLKSTFHAEVEFNYNFSAYQLEHSKLLGLLDMVGINLNPAIIWNAIPWSFVIDWVAGVSQWLNDRRVMNMEPQINIHRYLWSWQCNRYLERSFKSYQTMALVPPIGPIGLPRVYESAYRRDVELPSATAVQAGGLNLKEVTLGAALVTSRHRRPKSRVSLQNATRTGFSVH